MPQKVCEGYILNVMTYAFFSKMPQSRRVFVFLFFSVRNLITCFFRNASLFYARIWKTETLRFWDFSEKKVNMSSCAKYILHILFGSFYVNPSPYIVATSASAVDSIESIHR